MDGFGSHESLDVLTFCFENNIIICRQPSHATHKLQPCDIGVFSPLKTAYRDQVDQLYRNGADTVNKAHFTLLYSRAREIAMTSRNIRSGWSKAGLYPFNPARVLDTMQDIPATNHAEIAEPSVPMQPFRSPSSLVTPTNSISFVALQQKLEERHGAATVTDPYLQKLLNAGKQAIAGKELLQGRCDDLMKQNNEKKTRQHVRAMKIGHAKVMGYGDIVEALQARDRKEAEKGRKRAEREEKKATGKAANKISKSRVAKSNTKRNGTVASESEAGLREIEAAGISISPQPSAIGPVSAPRCGQDPAVLTRDARPVERAGDRTLWQAPVARMY